MMQGAGFLLAYVAVACWSLAMARHHEAILARPMRLASRRIFHATGWFFAIFSYFVAGQALGWGQGSVLWLCALGLMGMTHVVCLAYRPSWTPYICVAAMLTSAALLLGHLS